ncbi:MAG: hypothetical protein R2867_12075 [Caldilineaceae bacterium]
MRGFASKLEPQVVEGRLRHPIWESAGKPEKKYDSNWNITHMTHDSYGNVTKVTRMGAASNGSQNVAIETTYDTTYKLFPIEQWYTGNSLYKEFATYYGVNGLAVTDGKAFWGAMQEHCGVSRIYAAEL